MAFWLSIVDDGSAGRLAQKFLARAVALTIGAKAATDALAHTVEGTVLPLARDEAPKDTGALAASLRIQATPILDGYALALVSDVPYADDVIHGTGIYHEPDAHEAWDVNGLQAFTVNGETVVVMHTHHEGQKADDFPGRALERARPMIAAAADATGQRIVSLVWA